MILQALCEYYDRKTALGTIAPEGFIEKKIDFLIHLNEDGSFRRIVDLREPDGKRMAGQPYNVPSIGKQSQKHSNSGKDANLLWDNSAFVLGVGKKGEDKFKSFVDTIQEYYPEPPADVQSLLKFLLDGKMVDHVRDKAVTDDRYGKEIESGSPIITFRIGEEPAIVEQPHVADAVATKSDEERAGVCLISGRENVPIATTHSVIKGVMGGQTSGCNLVSFNAPSFCSYGLGQSHNAPTSKAAANAYVKALQSLIDSENNMVRIADATVVFWAQYQEKPEAHELEDGLWGTFADPPKDDPEKGGRLVKNLLNSIKTGKYMEAEGDFYVLGLSPNAARLSVRYWESGPLGKFASLIEMHFNDFSIIHHPDDLEYLSLSQILRSTAFDYKISNTPPNVGGDVVRSILTGRSYPKTLYSMAVRRNRAERNVNRGRAAILKAFINREIRLGKPGYKGAKEITMALDKQNRDIGYRLGRLFAVLEKIQEEALGKLNAGIRDRFYGAASATPVSVFSRLLQLKNHHIGKLSEGLAIHRERTIGEIMEAIQAFPAHLTMEQQGNFAIGYYHQRQDFFTKTADKNNDNASKEEA